MHAEMKTIAALRSGIVGKGGKGALVASRLHAAMQTRSQRITLLFRRTSSSDLEGATQHSSPESPIHFPDREAVGTQAESVLQFHTKALGLCVLTGLGPNRIRGLIPSPRVETVNEKESPPDGRRAVAGN